ncbi:mannose-1-phosphate guanyltransferase [Brachybacterium endophyticum]|uniref:Mannose-1-phosphate guanyltransferase n=1 Tax=Brachybacterium endophyticum TaxID=2182385 RepID=A0A2U2RGN1_9MICO|nr:mannose-1-phosphate guanylyltransferase [Brachybacterium endophyticum]PWH05016.1 mannose-1-phosphate guanyltransferase [Brachybacterium endophyticum]
MPEDESPDDRATPENQAADAVSGRQTEDPAPFVPVVPAGGAGTRLWPLSRQGRPKFLLDPTGRGRSLLQKTLDRLSDLADAPPCVVTGEQHVAAVREQVDGAAVRVLAEPSPRDSMPAIALAAAVIEREAPDAVIGSFAADHEIGDEGAFRAAVASARRAAERGYLATIGITPTRPATGFGYIERSEGHAPSPLPSLEGTGARLVASFVEKPDAERAAQFLAGGRHLWNAGMFVVRARVLLDSLAEQIPSLASGVRRIAAALEDDPASPVLAETWPALTRIPIDHALAEPLAAQGRVAVVPAALDWDDVGDYAALARQVRRARGDGDREQGSGGEGSDVAVVGSVRTLDRRARATVYGSSQRPIALVGVDGVSVVETDDVLLVVGDDDPRALAELVARLEETGHADLR